MTLTMPLLDRNRATLQPALRAAVARLDPTNRLAAEYHLGWCDSDGTPCANGGGKALRPSLALLSAEAVGAPGTVALPGAAAVELVHNFSLIHDDLLDRDVERRHRRTVWAIWGPATAILVGDALLALAHEVVLDAAAVPGDARVRAALLLAATTRELTRGQTQDLAFETRHDVGLDECLDMAAAKTGSLLAASAAIGAVLAGAGEDTVAALHSFGAEFGLAFQLVDDVLGIWGDTAVTGKPVGSDLRARKKSLPVTWALGHERHGPRVREFLDGSGEPDADAVRAVAGVLAAAGARDWALAEAGRRMTRAERALAQVDLHPDARADMLTLARFAVERDS